MKVNPTLQDHPVSLSSEGGISMEMEKILRKMPAGGEGMESTKVLELNPNHAVFGALKAAHEPVTPTRSISTPSCCTTRPC